MYSHELKRHVDKAFGKLAKKDPKQLEIIVKKLEQILQNPYRFKSLKGKMKGLRRIHIDKSFVLVYSIDEKNRTVVLEDYDHHDNIYK